MSPNEAAELLGIPASAGTDEVQRAYEQRIVEAGADVQRRDAVTAARDALLAASSWQAPGGNSAAMHSPATQPPAAQPSAAQPPAPPQAAAQPSASQPPTPPQHPTGQPFTPPPPGYPPQQPPYAAAPAPWYPAPPARRGLSTGAIVGITLGSMAGGLVILLVALFTIAAIAHDSSRLAQPGGSSTEAPFAAPSDTPSDDPTDAAPDDPATVDDYDVDGVHVHYVDGWTFELTPDQTCAGATVTAGFSDTPDGDEVDQWSTTVDLEEGVPYTFTIPDSASVHDYAGIDAVDCGQA
ncbi:hypothetical protein [Leifsonia shinshuensis]|uniref:hypothetical protein n=1 Tax=Leifsonia shinshuensis TaxID=150026 RepID=UPI002861FC47|nr:hypothetical protein [Leifsonia shinshuensis]MDR6972437.1 outer membrane biosynthesis protein TonB [Leifsonia shinshuensis]